FVERLWRSVKYEEVYLRAYDNVSEARASIGRYLDFYNGRRPHQSLDDATPIKPTSTSRHSAWRPNPGRRSTYRRGDSVQTSGTNSMRSSNRSTNSRMLGGSSRISRSHRRRSSLATSSETSLDQPSAVLNPPTRTGLEYCSSSKSRMTIS